MTKSYMYVAEVSFKLCSLVKAGDYTVKPHQLAFCSYLVTPYAAFDVL